MTLPLPLPVDAGPRSRTVTLTIPWADEEWRPVKGWPYEVSNHGRVRNAVARVQTKVGRIRKPTVSRTGYAELLLKDRGRRMQAKVHRLVAGAFIGAPPTDRPEVNHIDGAKLNNHVENLEWVNRSENILHSFRIGLRDRPRGPRTALLREDAERARDMVLAGVDQRDAARAIGISAGYFSNLLSGKVVPIGLEGVAIGRRKRCKLSFDDMAQARRMLKEGARYRDVAPVFGISASQLCRIINGVDVPFGLEGA